LLMITTFSFSPVNLNITENWPSDNTDKYLFIVCSKSLATFSNLKATIPDAENAFFRICRLLDICWALTISLLSEVCLTKNFSFSSLKRSTLVLCRRTSSFIPSALLFSSFWFRNVDLSKASFLVNSVLSGSSLGIELSIKLDNDSKKMINEGTILSLNNNQNDNSYYKVNI
jgi:hypothetical protein